MTLRAPFQVARSRTTRFRLLRMLRFALPCAAIAVSGALRAQMPGPCWESTLGTNLGLSDDSLAVGQQLGFPFPLPGGGSSSAIDVSSNGFVWLGSGSSTSSGCCDGSVGGLLSEWPRIAPAWMNLDPSAGGGVYFSTFPGRAVVTWNQVPEHTSGGRNSVQLQLYSDGSFSIAIRALNLPGSHAMLVGVSPGGNAPDPGEIDFSAQPPLLSSTPTIYELFATGTETRDIVGRTYWFLPGSQGYLVLPVPACTSASWSKYGHGCPMPPVIYELFDSTNPNDLSGSSFLWTPNGTGGWTVTRCTTACYETNFSNNLALGDDQLSVRHALGFSYPIPGSTNGSTGTIDISSNGWVGLVSGSFTNSAPVESVSGFLTADERFAVLWDDLDPASGGGVYFDTFPGRAVITWSQVPESPAVGSNSAQLQLFANGDAILSYPPGNTLTDGMIGYSPGRSTVDPGQTDFTARVPFDTGRLGLPIQLDLSGGTLPQLGASIVFTSSRIPSSGVAAFLNLGFHQFSIDLSPTGAIGCFMLCPNVATAPMSMQGSTATLPLTVPNTSSLIGGTVYAQGLVLAPGSNPLGLVTTNGLLVTVGI